MPLSINDLKVIGIHGPLNGGKDTVANYLQSKFPGQLGRYAFARPIKQACQVLFGFTNEQLEDRVKKEEVDPFWGFSPRRAMQLLGTEFARDMLRKDVWIRRAELEIAKNVAAGKATVITDVRFENEAEWLRSQPGAILIYLTVPNLEKDDRYLHASEAGVSTADTDHRICNDKSLGLAPLFSQLDSLFV